MRFVAAILGIFASVPSLLFFWIGAQTFARPLEKALATGVTLLSGALLLSSAILLFSASIQRVQVCLLIATVVIVSATLMTARS